MRRCLVLSGLFVLSFIVSLGTSHDSSAASVYDEAYQTIDKLELQNNVSPISKHDITTQFLQMLNGNAPEPFTYPRYTTNTSGSTVFCNPEHEPCGIYTSVLQDLNSLDENDSWFISVSGSNNEWPQPFICYMKNAQIELVWTETTVSAVDRGFCVLIDSNTTLNRYIMRVNNQSSKIISSVNGATKNLFCANCIVNYPENYEGEMIRESLTINEQWDWTPNIKLHSGSDWKIELSDYRFFTTDMILPFTCGEEEFAPAINWKIYEEVDEEWELVDEMLASASGIVYFQGEKKQSETKYLFVAKYAECENVEFTDESQREFTIDGNGNLVQEDILTSCITEEFPFVDMNGCLKSLAGMLDILAFGGLPVGSVNKIDDTAGCRNLHTLGHWINKPNIQVCPAIPEYVRNIVTPFVTLALGLLIIRLVVGRQEAGVKTW